MKKLLFLPLILLFTLAYSVQAQTAKGQSVQQVTLICKIIDAAPNAESIGLFEQIGMAYREVARGQRQDDGSYTLTIPGSEPRIYSIGFNESQNGRIILGSEKEVTLWANAQFMEKGRTVGSAINKTFEEVRGQITTLRGTGDQLRIELRQARASRDAATTKTAREKLLAHSQEKVKFLESLKKSNPMFWRTATLQLSPDDTAERAGNTGELEFYGQEFFGFADLSNAGYEEIPDVFDAFQNYVLTVSQLGASAASSKALIDAQLAKLTQDNKIRRRAMAGVVDGMQKANHPEYATYAREYVKRYKNQDLGEVGRLEYELKKTATFTEGMEAPDLAGNTPEGVPYALSKLRGKYVLIDFWASWCGPCRRENPNVVAMYNKYHPKGFDILGVSLDRTEDAWKKAIEADGLGWHHISDLQGWKSEHAALYSVSSIPQTVLIDPEGKIIQRNLRGEQLGEKLKQIFGE